jgi:hypothetical protein
MADATYTSVNTTRGSGFGARIKSALVRAFEAMAQAREQEARRKVAHYLVNLDDKTLTELGYSREEIQHWT